MKISFNGQIKRGNWECYAWTVNLNGQLFEYYTGLGHVTESKDWNKPKTLAGNKLLKALKSKNALERIIAWEL